MVGRRTVCNQLSVAYGTIRSGYVFCIRDDETDFNPRAKRFENDESNHESLWTLSVPK